MSHMHRSRATHSETANSRTEMPTIVVQPAQPIIQIPRQALWERLLSLAASVTSLAVAIAALVIANRSYQDQHATDVQAFAVSNGQYAEQVSAWIIPPSRGAPARVVVQNLGSTPISDTMALLTGNDTTAETRRGRGLTQAVLGVVPPCSVATVPLSRSTVRKLDVPLQLVRIHILSFTDINGVSWYRHDDGQLQNLESGTPDSTTVSSHLTISRAPAGCT